MPKVTAPAREMQSGEVVTQFTDTASTTTTTFTYSSQQQNLRVINKGIVSITLTVNGTNYTIQPSQTQAVTASFTSFAVQSASGTQPFEARAWNLIKDTSEQLRNHESKPDHMRGDIQIVVAASGGDFTSIQSAINSITDATADKRYDVLIRPGTYAETITTKDYVNLIGDSAETCIVNYVAPNPANWVNESTIFSTSTTLIENLTAKATNAKYPIHSDAAAGAYRLVVRNCKLIHLGSTDGTTQTSGTPIGVGAYQNQHIEIYDSLLQGYNQANDVGAAGVYCHNQADAAGAGFRSLRVQNCDIQNVAYGIRLECLAGSSSQENDAYLIGNRIHAYTSDIFYVGAAADVCWNVKAHGNNLRRVTNSGGNSYIVEEPGFTKRIRSQAAIVKGSVVVLFASTYYGLGTMTTVADSPLVVGVALQDIPSGTQGVIQVKGWVNSMKVDGTTAIADQDLLSTHTVAGVAKKGTTNAFAIAKGTYATADSNGMIPAILTKTVYN